jgi:hypothetical protein
MLAYIDNATDPRNPHSAQVGGLRPKVSTSHACAAACHFVGKY